MQSGAGVPVTVFGTGATLAVGRAWGHREVAVSGDGGEARVAVARVAAGFAGPLVRVLVVWWGLLTVAVIGAGFLVALPAAADAATTTTIVNFDAAGHQVTRYDTVGDAVDAHDGDLALFGDLYYLYGTRYDCGYTLGVTGTRFCGFGVYSSPDLVHWTDRGSLFDATGALWQGRCAPPRYGCYRPHVVFNAGTGRFVLWVNGYDNASGYHVFTAGSPTGPFTEVAEPVLPQKVVGANVFRGGQSRGVGFLLDAGGRESLRSFAPETN